MKKYYWVLIVLFILTVGARFFFAFQTPYFDQEAYFNLRQIEHISETGLPAYDDDLSYGGRTYYFPPFFHYLLAFFNLLLPLGWVGKVVPNLLISSLVFIVFLTAKQITKRENAALFAAFISGFIPILFSETVFAVSELTLTIPLVFLALYCLMNLQNKKFLYTYLGIIVLLSLTHASTFLLILALLLYLLVMEVEIIRRNRAETELILFSTFVFLWIQSLFYKKAFLMHGVSLIWKNMPQQIIASHFSQVTILGTITKIGWLPFFYGIYLMFKYLFKEKNKYIYMYMSLAVPVVLLLWMRWIEPALGLIYLGVTLSILFSEFFKISMDYFKKTKFARLRYMFMVLLTLTFLLTSVFPAVFLAQDQFQEIVPDSEIEALAWLGEEGGKVVLGALEDGHLIAYLSKKENVWDSNFLFEEEPSTILEDVKKIYTSQSKIESVGLLDKYEVDYILVSPNIKKDYGIENLFFRDEFCIRKVYQGETDIYKNNCEIKVSGI